MISNYTNSSCIYYYLLIVILDLVFQGFTFMTRDMKICFIHTLSHVSFLINIMPRSSTSQVDADANEHGRRGEDGSRQGGCFFFFKGSL